MAVKDDIKTIQDGLYELAARKLYEDMVSHFSVSTPEWSYTTDSTKALFLRHVTPNQIHLPAPDTQPMPRLVVNEPAPEATKPDLVTKVADFWIAPIKVWETFFLIIGAFVVTYLIR